MKIIIKSIEIFSLSIVYSYSACDFKAKLGTKKTVFEKLEITGPPLPSEYENFYIYCVLAEDFCPSEKLEDVAIEYKFINDEALPGTGIDTRYFWKSLDKEAHELTPKNKNILKVRHKLLYPLFITKELLRLFGYYFNKLKKRMN